MVVPAEGYYAIHSHRRRLLIWPVKDVFIYVNIRLPLRAAEANVKPEPTPTAQGLLDQVIVAALERAYEDYLLLHGTMQEACSDAITDDERL